MLSRLAGCPVEVNGAGRTDARYLRVRPGPDSQLPHENGMFCREIQEYANRYLPEDIAVLSLEEAPERFHARLHAAGKALPVSAGLWQQKACF